MLRGIFLRQQGGLGFLLLRATRLFPSSPFGLVSVGELKGSTGVQRAFLKQQQQQQQYRWLNSCLAHSRPGPGQPTARSIPQRPRQAYFYNALQHQRNTVAPHSPTTISPPILHTIRQFHTTRQSLARNTRFQRFENTQALWRNNELFRMVVVGLGGAFIAFYLYNQETVPITGRRRFNWYPAGMLESMADEQQKQILQQYKEEILPANDPRVILVTKVLNRLIPHSSIPDKDWEVHVIDDDEIVNAFVIPGGKVFVFTGIIPIAKDEAGLAAVLGHEIAHNVADHASERASWALIFIGAAIALASLLDVSTGLSQLLLSIMFERPNSRTQEAEADHIGLLMMGESCYDPKAAVDFWNRMGQVEKVKIPQFMSTHPSSYNRQAAIQQWVPDAQKKAEEGGCFNTSGYFDRFQEVIRSDRGQVSVNPPVVKDEDFW